MADSLNNHPQQIVDEGSYYSRFGGDDTSLLAKIGVWNTKLDTHYSDWLTEAEESFNMVAGRQWSDEEEEGMLSSNRVPVTFNRMQPTIDAVAGAEIQGRQQVQYFPREVGDSAVSEILTQGADYEMDRCDGNEEDSDAFRDCLICGVGVTETRNENDDGEVNIIKERIDPLEVLFDPGRAKACFSDARFLRREKSLSKEEFDELWPDADPLGTDSHGKRRTIVDPEMRYKNGNLGDGGEKGDVKVCEWQWYEVERYLIGAVPKQDELGQTIGTEIQEISEEDLAMYREVNPDFQHTTQTRRVFYRAFVSGPEILELTELEVGDFTYKAITGKRDRNKGTFYGLVRPMKDPQKFANKFFAQILHIINSNAKGGVAVEEGAISDVRVFEQSWAQTDAVTWVKDGALTASKIMPKAAPAYPQGSDRLMSLSVDAIRDVTGVNMELLGLADRDQPGILEQQRKQAAYGILAAFFDARRRYMKMSGRLLLKFIQLYLPEDKLVRILGEDGQPQYVPLALSKETAEYDIIVDEAPASPNQKLQTFQILTQIMPMLTNANLPDSFWIELVKYSPLPASLSQKLAQSMAEGSEPSPEEQQMAQTQQQLAMRGAVAEVGEKEANAALATAEAQQKGAEIPNNSAKDQTEARLNMARVAEIQNRIVNDLQDRTSTQDD